MEFYIILFTLFVALSVSGLWGNAKPPMWPMQIIILVLAIFVAFRVDVGNDWILYKDTYYTGIASDKPDGKIEPLFKAIRDICFSLGFSYSVFLYILSCFSLLAVYKAARMMHVSNIYIVFLVYIALFFCNFQFNILRTGIMGSCVWLAYAYKAQKCNVKAWIWIIIACGFHYVGFVFVLIMLLIDKKWNPGVVMSVLGISVFLFLMRFGEKVISAFPFLAMVDRIEGYVDTDRHDSYGISIGMVFNACLFLWTYFMYRGDYLKSVYIRVMINALFIWLIIGLTLNVFDTIVARIGQPLNMASLFLWPFILYNIKRRQIKILISCSLIIYLSLYYYKSWGIVRDNGDTPMLPYQMDLELLFEEHL